MKSYKDKVVWITGASSGIGEALVEEFIKEGAVVIASSHESEELERVKEKYKGISEKIYSVVFNLGDPEAVAGAAEKVLSEHKRVDVLMNNGGISTRALASETAIDIDRRLMEIDYFAHLLERFKFNFIPAIGRYDS